MPKLSNEKIRLMQEAFKSGTSMNEIAGNLGVTVETVHYNLDLDYREYRRAIKKKSLEKWRKCHPNYDRDYHRRTSIGVIRPDGTRGYLRNLSKRPYTGICELCGRLAQGKSKLSYHHWDDGNPSLGLWLCLRCHTVAEALDNIPDLTASYLALKEKASLEVSKTG